VTSVTGFGRQGPFAGVKSYEGIVQAKLGSFASFRKITRGVRPPFVTAAYASFAASQTTLHGVLAALIEREQSGVGQHVEGNLVQGFTSLDSWNWFVYLVHQRWPDAFLANDLYDADGTPAGVFPFLLMVAIGVILLSSNHMDGGGWVVMLPMSLLMLYLLLGT